MGVNLEERDANGMTALHCAADKGQVETMRVVVELGADKEAKTAHGWSPLHAAAYSGHVEVIKVLVVELGAQVDAQMADGQTPLQVSIRHGHHQAAQLLRELERTARARKAAATSERAQQATEQADCNAAALIEEEEREEAQSKVRGVELAPVCGVRDAVSLTHTGG